jgi:hypothetical protein
MTVFSNIVRTGLKLFLFVKIRLQSEIMFALLAFKSLSFYWEVQTNLLIRVDRRQIIG